MKFFVATILTALLSFLASIYFNFWWSFIPVAFGVALLVHQKAGKAFIAGFLSLFLLWSTLALWMDLENEHILSRKIALLFPLGGSPIVLLLITGLVGGVAAGFAALTGSYLRSMRTGN